MHGYLNMLFLAYMLDTNNEEKNTHMKSSRPKNIAKMQNKTHSFNMHRD